jgi:sugar phosphate isomerase/epimerase
LAAEAGFDGVELVVSPEVTWRGPQYVRTLARECGLYITGVHQSMMPLHIFGSSQRMFSATQCALELGCPIVVIHDAGVTDWDDPAADRWLRQLDRCQRLTEGSGTQIALENPGWYRETGRQNVLANPDALRRFAEQRGLALTLDTCHVGTAGQDLLAAHEILADRIINVHLSDYVPLRRLPALKWVRTLFAHHQVPGDGELPLVEFLEQLVADGYEGPLTLEISVAALRVWSGQAVRRELDRAASYVRSGLTTSLPAGR